MALITISLITLLLFTVLRSTWSLLPLLLLTPGFIVLLLLDPVAHYGIAGYHVARSTSLKEYSSGGITNLLHLTPWLITLSLVTISLVQYRSRSVLVEQRHESEQRDDFERSGRDLSLERVSTERTRLL